MTLTQQRSGLAVARAALHALILREAVVRMFGRRAALAWLVLEPAIHIGVLALIYEALRIRHVAGMATAWWIVTGMLAFHLFQRTALRSTQAIDANRALFAYRQVKPVDTVVARCIFEGLAMTLVAASTVIGAVLAGLRISIEDPISLITALVLLWLLAAGWALCMSVAVALIPEFGIALSLAGIGMMVFSGVMFPIGGLPVPARQWFFLNPITHGVEAVRASVSHLYHPAPELSLGYMGLFALTLLLAGLLLQVRFEQKVVSQ